MKPGDFLIGVLDFFAILLPGSIATWLATRYIPPAHLLRQLSFGPETQPESGVLVAAFFLSSYVLGHFVFMAGSRIDSSYDRWRARTKPSSSDQTYQAADALKKRLTPTLTGGSLSTLKWSKAFIQVQSPPARAEIDRLEADSKFFRSLVVVAAALALHFAVGESAPGNGLACAVFGFIAYTRYVDQRWKLTQLSYGTAVILSAVKPQGAETVDVQLSE
jgi:hypothetical protein